MHLAANHNDYSQLANMVSHAPWMLYDRVKKCKSAELPNH